MNNQALVITLIEAEKLGPQGICDKYGHTIFNARHVKKQVILEYADYFSIEQLYTLAIRKSIDGEWVRCYRVSSK